MKEQIEEIACEKCLHHLACLTNSEYVPTRCPAYEDKAGYSKQEWISVADRLPEDVYGKDREQITVLVYTEGKKVSQCSRCSEYKLIEREPLDRDVFRRTGKFYWNKSKRVTHWMPLPEPPKMKGGAE